MKNRKNYINNRVLYLAMACFSILIIFSFGIFAFINSERVNRNNREYLINDATILADRLDQTLKDGYTNITILSKLIGDSLTSAELNIKDYQNLINDSVFDFMEFADKDGMDHNIIGGISVAQDRQYYQDAMNGNIGMELIYNSRATHETLLMFYAPVYYENKIIGSLVGAYQADHKLMNLMETYYFGEPVASYLCTSEGRVVAGTQSFDSGSELYVDQAIGADNILSEQIRNSLTDGRNLSFALQGNKVGGYLVRMPESAWYLVQIFPVAANRRMAFQANVIAFGLVLFLLLLFTGLLRIVYLSHIAQRRQIEDALAEVQKAEKENTEHLNILQSVADIYYSMHLIDLTSNYATEYSARNQVKEAFDRNDAADQMMKKIMTLTVQDSHLEEALSFTDLNTLSVRMQGKKIVSRELLGKNIGWFQVSFVTVETDAEQKPVLVVCTTQSIDEEKKKEQKLIIESNTDELTGFFNRRGYEDNIEKYHDFAAEEDFVYVSMDVNGLKQVNDELGHAAGDELLKGAAECMKRCFGPYGGLFRTGGDEFAAIIFANEEQLESIRNDFRESTLKWSGKLVEDLAVSCGYVTKRESNETSVRKMALIADKRMYRDKALFYQKKGIDRRGQKDAHTALCDLYTKILKVNVTKDTYQIVNMDMEERTAEKGFADRISEWFYNFGVSGQVHPDDLESYQAQTDLTYIQNYFKGDKTSLIIFYRRRIRGDYKQVMMELIPAKNYTDLDQNLYLYVKDIDR